MCNWRTDRLGDPAKHPASGRLCGDERERESPASSRAPAGKFRPSFNFHAPFEDGIVFRSGCRRIEAGMKKRTLVSPGTSAGFTLIEIMLVVGIITVLMGSAIFMLTGNLEFAKEQRARGDLQAITTQIRMYEMKSGGVQLTEAQGLNALVGKGKGFEQLPKDPWGQEYKYKVDSSSAKGFRVYSMGPDRKDDRGGGDDISSN